MFVGISMKLSWLFVLLLLTSACGNSDDADGVAQEDGHPTATSTVSNAMSSATHGADSTSVPATETVPPESSNPTQSTAADGSVVNAFRVLQEQYDFDIAIPTNFQNLQMLPESPSASGPPAQPIINATFAGKGGPDPEILSFVQSPGPLPAGNSASEGEREQVMINGVEATLLHGANEMGEETVDLRWHVNGVNYTVESTSIEFDSVVAFAESIKSLSQLPS